MVWMIKLNNVELTSPFLFLWCAYQQTLEGEVVQVVETKAQLKHNIEDLLE